MQERRSDIVMNALDLRRVVNVTVNLSPVAAQRRGFGTLMIMGDSNVISVNERYRTYQNLEAVANDFSLTAPEYLAAALYYGQTPQPSQLMIGRWASESTSAILTGASLSAVEQEIATWNAITNGYFVIDINGTKTTVQNLDFASVTNLNQVASAIGTAITDSVATVQWTGERFVISTVALGSSVTIGYAAEDGTITGTYIGNMLKLSQSTATSIETGSDAETPVETVTKLVNLSSAWYGLTLATTAEVTDEQKIAIAAFIEGVSLSRVFGITTTDTRVMDAVYTQDIASQLKKLKYSRTITVYSSSNPYAMASAFGRAFTVNFSASSDTITLKFKQLPGVIYENLTETQANTLAAKNCNVFAYYNNDTAIFQEGVMANGDFFDERHGLDWWQDATQNAVYNLLYQSKTKVPQTNAGMALIANTIQTVCEEGISNGLLASEALVWNADGFGELQTGDTVEGYYIYVPPISSQAQSDREARKSVPIQVALKLAGAVHFVDVIANVNR